MGCSPSSIQEKNQDKKNKKSLKYEVKNKIKEEKVYDNYSSSSEYNSADETQSKISKQEEEPEKELSFNTLSEQQKKNIPVVIPYYQNRRIQQIIDESRQFGSLDVVKNY